MEHQHNTRVSEPAPRIVQGMTVTCTKHDLSQIESGPNYKVNKR